MSRAETRIGLVLGAGGYTGMAFHAGVLAALHEHGWDPRTADVVVGTSAGSMIGALLRGGVAPAAMGRRRAAEGAPAAADQRAPDVRRRSWPVAPGLVARAALRPWAVRPGAVLAAVLPAGSHDLDDMAAGVREVLGDTWPQRPLWLPAVSLRDGRRVVLGRDAMPVTDPATAVLASCAVPGWFRPVTIDGVRYVDGGAHSPTNADLVRDLGLDLVVVSSPMSVARRVSGPRPALAARGALARLLARELAPLRRAGVPIVAFQPTGPDLEVLGGNALSPRHVVAVRDRARASAAARLEAGRLPEGAAAFLAA